VTRQQWGRRIFSAMVGAAIGCCLGRWLAVEHRLSRYKAENRELQCQCVAWEAEWRRVRALWWAEQEKAENYRLSWLRNLGRAGQEPELEVVTEEAR
jgi:hypothetical protein